MLLFTIGYVLALTLIVIVAAVVGKYKGTVGLAVCFAAGWTAVVLTTILLSSGPAGMGAVFALVIAVGAGLGAAFYGMERHVRAKSIGAMVAWGLVYSIPVGLLTPFALLIIACSIGDCL